ncbi:unnamed protein product [Ilex paraguariensis]|uniref:Uncharacterized protein n=1 Tax=Ilex paraguariensis TaxID=185542 RepID=A0ABC8RUT3_9AQUA
MLSLFTRLYVLSILLPLQVSVLADDILKNVEYDALRIVFNKFQSVVSFVPTVATLLSPEVVEREAESGGKLVELDSYEIEGGETKLCSMRLWRMLAVSKEQGARMSAMDSSSRNAGDMLDRLTLTYNRRCQNKTVVKTLFALGVVVGGLDFDRNRGGYFLEVSNSTRALYETRTLDHPQLGLPSWSKWK